MATTTAIYYRLTFLFLGSKSFWTERRFVSWAKVKRKFCKSDHISTAGKHRLREPLKGPNDSREHHYEGEGWQRAKSHSRYPCQQVRRQVLPIPIQGRRQWQYKGNGMFDSLITQNSTVSGQTSHSFKWHKISPSVPINEPPTRLSLLLSFTLSAGFRDSCQEQLQIYPSSVNFEGC